MNASILYEMLKFQQYANVSKLTFKQAEAPLHGHTEFEVISSNGWMTYMYFIVLFTFVS
jgi:hypothetical protein